jgi:hypothetical protein
MKASCPICGKKVEFGGNEFRPFCSERCKLIDLGKWIEECYRVPGPELPLEPEALESKDKKDLQ